MVEEAAGCRFGGRNSVMGQSTQYDGAMRRWGDGGGMVQ